MASKGWGAEAYTFRKPSQGPLLVHFLATQLHLLPCVPSDTIHNMTILCCHIGVVRHC